MALHVRPFRGKDAEHHRVSRCAVSSRLMVTKDAVLASAKGRDCALRRNVEAIGPQANHLAA
jgi:hypothetical protein